MSGGPTLDELKTLIDKNATLNNADGYRLYIKKPLSFVTKASWYWTSNYIRQ